MSQVCRGIFSSYKQAEMQMKRWSRLVRFNAQGHGDKIFLGQPVDPNVDGTLYYILFDTISDILVFSRQLDSPFILASLSSPMRSQAPVLSTVTQWSPPINFRLQNYWPLSPMKKRMPYATGTESFLTPITPHNRGVGSDLTRPLIRGIGLNYVDQAEEAAHLAGQAKAQLPT